MSDEHEEHDHGHDHPMPLIQFITGPSPEEMERQRLNAMANAHELHHFVDTLDETGLTKLVDLI